MPDDAVAVQRGDLIFIGDPLVADTGTTEAGAVHEQAALALERIGRIVEQAGGSRDDVVDIVSFHIDSRDIEPVFDVGREFFQADFPAWTPVAATILPVRGQRVAMSAIAMLGGEPKHCIVPDTIAWWRDYPVSAGCKKGDLLFVAGQYGSDADGNINTPGDHAGQARNALNRIKEICELAGGSLGDVLDLTSFHQDPRWIDSVVDMCRSEFFDSAVTPVLPAWTTVGTPGLLKHGMLGQYRAIAEFGGDRLASVAGVVASSGEGEVIGRGDPEAQAVSCLEHLETTLDGLGASLDDVVQVRSYHLDAEAMDVALAVADGYFAGSPPAWTAAGMTGFQQEGHLHCIQALTLQVTRRSRRSGS